MVERLQAAAVRAVVEWDAHTDWALDGALSPRTWLTHRAPITSVGASKLVGMARLARKHEATGEALRSVRCRARTSRSSPRWCATVKPNTPTTKPPCSGAAKSMRADDFGIVARHWRGIANDEMDRLDARTIYERRNLHVHKSLFGMGVLEGDLDADGTKILLEALDHCGDHRMRPAARYRRARWRNAERMRWSTSAAPTSAAMPKAPRRST